MDSSTMGGTGHSVRYLNPWCYMTWRDRILPALLAALTAALGSFFAPRTQPVATPQTPPVQEAPPVPITPPPPAPLPKPVPKDATIQLVGGRAGCTGALVAPLLPDGRAWVLTAAHCSRAFGGKARASGGPLKSPVTVTFTRWDESADWAWGVTDQPVGDVDLAILAERTPAPNTAVWHKGHGVDVPGNREDGYVLGGSAPRGQTAFVLSVSSGDSGSPIYDAQTGEIVSVVCCTTSFARRVTMYGATVESIRAGRGDSVPPQTPAPQPERPPCR